MHVVRHQAPGPHLDPGHVAIRSEQVTIERVVVVVEKGARGAIATLGDMVRKTDNDNAREASHTPSCPRGCRVN